MPFKIRLSAIKHGGAPGHGEGGVSLQEAGQLDDDVVDGRAKSTPLGVVDQQDVLSEKRRRAE